MEAKQFNVSSESVVEGAFAATQPAGMYILPKGTTFDYTKYYTYSTGNVTSARIMVTLGPGSYWFVIAIANEPTNITITQNIEVITLPPNS
jgi:hypothetical protein